MGIIKEQRHNESLEYFGYIEMKNSRIMILSRLESTCKEMASYFRERAYSVIWCTEYDDAVRMMSNEKHRPDLFIFDLSVPAGSEYDVMRSAKLHPDIRTVVLAEDDHLESQLYAYSLQIDDYMVKPIQLRELMLRVGALLRRAQLLQQAQLLQRVEWMHCSRMRQVPSRRQVPSAQQELF